jgi:hypothetical protein
MKTDTTTTSSPAAPALDPLQKCSAAIKAATEQGRAVYAGLNAERIVFEKTPFVGSVNSPVAAECRSLLEHRATQERLRDACVRFDLGTYAGDLTDRALGAQAMLQDALQFVRAKHEAAKKRQAGIAAAVTVKPDDAPVARPLPVGGVWGVAEPLNVEAELVRIAKEVSEFPWTSGFVQITAGLNKINAELAALAPEAKAPQPEPFRAKYPCPAPRPSSPQPDNAYFGTGGRAPVVQPAPAPRRANAIVHA